MKTLFAVLLASSGLFACKKEEATGKVAAVIGQSFDLADKQTATLPTSSGSPLRITLNQVLDSRCPSGVQCITAGYAAVEVELADATATPQLAHISLAFDRLPGYTRDSVSVTLNQQKYWLRLLDVKPYPSGNTSQTKIATLRLRPY